MMGNRFELNCFEELELRKLEPTEDLFLLESPAITRHRCVFTKYFQRPNFCELTTALFEIRTSNLKRFWLLLPLKLPGSLLALCSIYLLRVFAGLPQLDMVNRMA